MDYFKKFVLAPLFAVLGVVLVGSVLEEALNIPNATIALFVALGGFVFFARLFK
jgi:hypothetical protein